MERQCYITHAEILLHYLESNATLRQDEKDEIRKVLLHMIRALRQPRLKDLRPLGKEMEKIVMRYQRLGLLQTE
jgi:hypothetical protein